MAQLGITSWTYTGNDYYCPVDWDINRSRQDIDDFLRAENYRVIIPMRERRPVIKFLLKSIKGRIPPTNIIIINDNSDSEVVRAARNIYPRVKIIDKEELLGVLDKQLLKFLMVSQSIPEGKGMAVLAGYLYVYLDSKITDRRINWLFQHDAEVRETNPFTNFDYLVWTLLNHQENVDHVKIAKTGRGNERSMSARSLLLTLINLPSNSPNNRIKVRAIDLFKKLAPLKWMLTGQFVLRYDLAVKRPFASGYLEETLLSAFVKDTNPSTTLQVANPYPCLDDNNNARKEDRMQQLISNFLFALAYYVKPLSTWMIEDIREVNSKFMAVNLPMSFIPDNEQPVDIECVPNERIIPSITMLDNHGLIDWDKAKEVIEKYK